MRGYFGIGVEGISKAMNLGNLFRSALGFDASFIFTVNADFNPKRALSDTADTPGKGSGRRRKFLPRVAMTLLGTTLGSRLTMVSTPPEPDRAERMLRFFSSHFDVLSSSFGFRVSWRRQLQVQPLSTDGASR